MPGGVAGARLTAAPYADQLCKFLTFIHPGGTTLAIEILESIFFIVRRNGIFVSNYRIY